MKVDDINDRRFVRHTAAHPREIAHEDQSGYVEVLWHHAKSLEDLRCLVPAEIGASSPRVRHRSDSRLVAHHQFSAKDCGVRITAFNRLPRGKGFAVYLRERYRHV